MDITKKISPQGVEIEYINWDDAPRERPPVPHFVDVYTWWATESAASAIREEKHKNDECEKAIAMNQMNLVSQEDGE